MTYTYGDALGEYSGRIKATRELAQLQYEVSEFTVYVVEVCQTCGWNHLRESYVLGHGGRVAAAPATARRSARCAQVPGASSTRANARCPNSAPPLAALRIARRPSGAPNSAVATIY